MMACNEHIYNPKDSTLQARIRAYRSVREAWLNTEASLKMLDDEEWADTLGEREEVEQAHEVSVRSLTMATENISQEEVREAISEGLLEAEEAKELIQHKRHQQMQDIREGNEYSDSSESSHKQ